MQLEEATQRHSREVKLLLEKQERDHESFVERTGQVESCRGNFEAVAGRMRRGGMMLQRQGTLVLSVPLATKPDLLLPMLPLAEAQRGAAREAQGPGRAGERAQEQGGGHGGGRRGRGLEGQGQYGAVSRGA